ncbi:hypothetical protein LTR37_002679 [Vermiconidia calcicola]|uniref:Uncharacterized protein n=1 Tax=Vermiconidia calcicola TaxID=1690605 RepID=A0ACC3NSQ9_9PEZI|nr:hypothetical protein LTR37_002679 [Vermiconidia calcicola]
MAQTLLNVFQNPEDVHPLRPRDGTPTFWATARCDDEGYNSDDEWTTPMHILKDFDLSTGWQRAVLSNRFRLPKYRPSAKPMKTARRGFMMKNADTIISLSPHQEDCLLVRSDLLRQSHPFFDAGFSRWSSNQLTVPVTVGDYTIRYRYELELDADGQTLLIGKQSATSREERKQKWTAMWGKWQRTPGAKLEPSFDESGLDQKTAMSLPTTKDGLQFLQTSVHKIGFALLCGYPAKLYRKGSQAVMPGLHPLGPQVERFILGPKVGKHVVKEYPHTFLRIANRIKGEELFRTAVAGSVAGYFEQSFEHWICVEDDPIPEDNPEYQPHPREGLAENLGEDYELVFHVLRMRDQASQKFREVFDDVMKIGTMKLGKGCGNQENLAARMRHEAVSSYVHSAETYTMEALWKISRYHFTAKNLFVAHRYRFHCRDVDFSDKDMKEKLSQQLATIVEEAKSFISDQLHANKDCTFTAFEKWDLEAIMDFSRYVYPWQIGGRDEPTCFTRVIDTPAFDD